MWRKGEVDLNVPLIFAHSRNVKGFPGGSDNKESTCNAGDLGQEDPLEEEMATYSSILAWEIRWTEEPGELQSMGSQESDPTEWVTLIHRSVKLQRKFGGKQ